MPPVSMTETAVRAEICNEGTSAGMARVARSRTVQKKTVARTSADHTEKAPKPGRRMIRTPIKPTAIALQRRHPTGSRNTMAAPMVTASGRAWKSEATETSGALARATR